MFKFIVGIAIAGAFIVSAPVVQAATIKGPSQHQLAQKWAKAVKKPINTQSKDMKRMGQLCSDEDVEGCRDGALKVKADADAVQAARAKHPAPECMSQADSSLGAGEDLISLGSQEIADGIDSDNTDLITKSGDDYQAATGDFDTATTLINSAHC